MAQSNKSAPDAPLGLTELLRRTPEGDTVYLTAAASTISACAAGAGIKVTTAKLLAIHPATKEVTEITEVTVIGQKAAVPAARPARRIRGVA